MKHLKMLAIPLLGIFMTGCVNMTNEVSIKSDGSAITSSIIDISQIPDDSTEKPKDFCAETKKSYEETSAEEKEKSEFVSCEEIEKGVYKIIGKAKYNKHSLNKNIYTTNIKEIINSEATSLDENKMSPIKTTFKIKFSGEILKASIGIVDGNSLTIKSEEIDNKDYEISYSAKKFDENSHTYKEDINSNDENILNSFVQGFTDGFSAIATEDKNEEYLKKARDAARKVSAARIRQMIMAEKATIKENETLELNKKSIENILNSNGYEIPEQFTEENPLYFIQLKESIKLSYCLEATDEGETKTVVDGAIGINFNCKEGIIEVEPTATVTKLFHNDNARENSDTSQLDKTDDEFESLERYDSELDNLLNAIDDDLFETVKESNEIIVTPEKITITSNFAPKKEMKRKSYDPDRMIKMLQQNTKNRDRNTNIFEDFFHKAAFKK